MAVLVLDFVFLSLCLLLEDLQTLDKKNERKKKAALSEGCNVLCFDFPCLLAYFREATNILPMLTWPTPVFPVSVPKIFITRQRQGLSHFRAVVFTPLLAVCPQHCITLPTSLKYDPPFSLLDQPEWLITSAFSLTTQECPPLFTVFNRSLVWDTNSSCTCLDRLCVLQFLWLYATFGWNPLLCYLLLLRPRDCLITQLLI